MNNIGHETWFLSLLRRGLGTERTAGEELLQAVGEDVWKKIYWLGVWQGVGVILLDGLQEMISKKEEMGEMDEDQLEEFMPPKALKSQWMVDCLNLEKVCRTQYALAGELAGIYAKHGIRTVVLKGIAAGSCYPRPLHRPCGDLDCFLMGDYERGNVVAEEAGAEVKRNFYKHSHINFKGLEVENHQFCTGIRGNRKIKEFERLLQGLLRDEGTTRIGETNLEAPSPMFNALFLTNHSQRHYLSEGIAMRHLCDWAMLLKMHGKEIDWVKFGKLAKKYGMKDFADTCTRISEKYLGVAVPEGYELQRDDERDDLLFRDIMGYHKLISYGKKWRTRLTLVKTIYGNRYRYRYFSDRTMLAELGKMVWGFIWDRNPSLD